MLVRTHFGPTAVLKTCLLVAVNQRKVSRAASTQLCRQKAEACVPVL